MNPKIGFFEEAPGQRSMTRLLDFILLVALILLVPLYFYCSLLNNGDIRTAITFMFVLVLLIWLIAVFSPKYLQKILELAAQTKGIKIPGMDSLNSVETSKTVETSKEVKQTEAVA